MTPVFISRCGIKLEHFYRQTSMGSDIEYKQSFITLVDQILAAKRQQPPLSTFDIETRISLRKIEYDLPQRIYENAEERFVDNETGHIVAVKNVIIYGKERAVMVAYEHEDADVKLLTIHPLKEGQKEYRVQSGRWRKICLTYFKFVSGFVLRISSLPTRSG